MVEGLGGPAAKRADHSKLTAGFPAVSGRAWNQIAATVMANRIRYVHHRLERKHSELLLHVTSDVTTFASPASFFRHEESSKLFP